MRFAPALRMLLAMSLGLALGQSRLIAGEPDPKTYWNIDEIRAGMKGVGKTVMVGTAMEEFKAEVLGVMKDVSPGRDMVLCRLSGCNLEHAGIIQGMSGSPIYVDGKLLGAVAFAWEFAKDPIAGVTPFCQMVQFVRPADKRIAAEAGGVLKAARQDGLWNQDEPAAAPGPIAATGGALAGMRPIATPLAASGFSVHALAFLSERLGPLGMAATAGGSVQEEILKREGDKPLLPGSPLSIAMVTGDFDLSGIGTVTHVEGDRVYGFGHPMFSLGSCDFPMMTGYIHTVYPRANVSMKMGSPLKTVGVLDTDVSTAVSGRVGLKPDMLPLRVKVKVGRYSEPRTFNVQIVREPNLMSMLVMAVLSNAIDTEGNLPEELTARLKVQLTVKDHDPIVLADSLSGARYTGPMGPAMLFGPVANAVNILVRNPIAALRIEAIDCDVEIDTGRTTAEVESVRLASDRLEPGQTLKAIVTLKPFKGERESVEVALPLPADFPEGHHEAAVCDLTNSFRRRFRNDPSLLEPRDVPGLLRMIHFQTGPKRTGLFLHVALPDRGLAVSGQPLPNLPGSARAVLAGSRQTPLPALRADLIGETPTAWVIDGSQSVRFNVVRDAELSLKD
jgi:hypothetical protein